MTAIVGVLNRQGVAFAADSAATHTKTHYDTNLSPVINKRNNYIDERQYQSIYEDCEELVKILVARCKKLDEQLKEGTK